MVNIKKVIVCPRCGLKHYSKNQFKLCPDCALKNYFETNEKTRLISNTFKELSLDDTKVLVEFINKNKYEIIEIH